MWTAEKRDLTSVLVLVLGSLVLVLGSLVLVLKVQRREAREGSGGVIHIHSTYSRSSPSLGSVVLVLGALVLVLVLVLRSSFSFSF